MNGKTKYLVILGVSDDRKARAAKFEELGPISLRLLGSALRRNSVGDLTVAESVLRRAQQLYPGDVWINHELGKVLESRGRPDEAIRFYTAARAIRRETHLS